jgi:glycosyltransferase involved in cell wall biosynthesis
MKSIILLAYAISPTRGSEYSVGWNFLMNLSKNNKVFVLCGLSGDHMGDTEEIEQYFKNNPHPNIKLITVKPTVLANIINWPNRIGVLGPIFYLAFPLWQKEAYRIAKEIVSTEKIDIIHHLNPIGFREPGYLWKIDKPFIWGPVGGAIFVNPILLKNFPLKHKAFFFIKNKINFLQLRFNNRIRKASSRASEIIFCSTDNKESFEKFLGITGEIISEQGTFTLEDLKMPNNKNENSELINLVWAGQISYRKNLVLLFNTLSLIKNNSKWNLSIIGDGNGINELKLLAQNLLINDKIIWHGKKKRSETIEIMSKADLHCMSSLAEGNPGVLYEAISLGIPTISLDKDGMHDTLKNENGILIPITSYNETTKSYASKIDELINNPNYLIELKERTINLASKVTWSKKIEQFEKIYDKAIKNY